MVEITTYHKKTANSNYSINLATTSNNPHMILAYYYYSSKLNLIPTKLELHYFFNDNSHTMDAYVRNNCESELLSIIRDITTFLDIKIEVETEPYQNGGLKQIWKFIGKNTKQLGIVIGATTLLLTQFPSHDSELVKAQKENIRLDNEKKKLEISELKIKVRADSLKNVSDEEMTKLIMESASFITDDEGIKRSRTRFYKLIKNYQKITNISITILTDNNNQIGDVRSVTREDFEKFIAPTDTIPKHNEN